MKRYTHFLILLVILVNSSCLHRTIEDIFMVAHHDYTMLMNRYHNFFVADERLIVEEAHLLARDHDISLSAYLWESFIGNDHITASEGAPLHKASYIMKQDIDLLDYHIRRFEQRGLFERALYSHMRDMRHDLLIWIRIIEKQKEFTQESQFIEQRRLQKTQLHEQQKQTELLTKIAQDRQPERSCKPKRHKEHHEHVHVQSYNVYL